LHFSISSPGFLAFREVLSLLVAAKQLKSKIDVFLVDGHGFSHPRRFGLACHIGLALCAPVVGVAKSLLVGTIKDSQIWDSDEVIGVVLHSNSGKTRYISVGHMISLEDARRIVMECTVNSDPEPLRYAHQEANLLRRGC
jgi:deoxyribonuclease V